MRRKERGYDNKWLAGKGEGEGGLAAEQSSDPRTFFADYKARIFVYNVSLFFSQIHYDGWPEEYDVWAEDSSPLIHPQGWCARTGHPLAPPLSEYCKRIQKNTARTAVGP